MTNVYRPVSGCMYDKVIGEIVWTTLAKLVVFVDVNLKCTLVFNSGKNKEKLRLTLSANVFIYLFRQNRNAQI
jgi:hypothetical protein